MLDFTVPVRVTGPAAAEKAWQRYARLSAWSDWAPQITAVRAPGDALVPGLRGEVLGPLGITVPFEVLTVDPLLMRWSWRVEAGPVPLQLEHGVVPLPTGCAATLRITGFAPVALGYAPLAALALTRLVR